MSQFLVLFLMLLFSQHLKDAVLAMPRTQHERLQLAAELGFYTFTAHGLFLMSATNLDMNIMGYLILNLEVAQQAFTDARTKTPWYIWHLLISCVRERFSRTYGTNRVDYEGLVKWRTVLKNYFGENDAWPSFCYRDDGSAMPMSILYNLIYGTRTQAFRRRSLAGLADSSALCFDQWSDPNYIYEVIDLVEELWKDSGSMDSEELEACTHLARSLHQCYLLTWNITDIKRGLAIIDRVLFHENDPWVKKQNINIWSLWFQYTIADGIMNYNRFDQHALDRMEDVVRGLPSDAPEGPIFYGNISYVYSYRWKGDELKKCLQFAEEAVSRATRLADPEKIAIAHNRLSRALRMQYIFVSEYDLLQEAIKSAWKSIELTDEQHHDFPMFVSWYCTLLSSTRSRIRHIHIDTSQLNHAIKLGENILKMPIYLDIKAEASMAISKLLIERFETSGQPDAADLTQAVEYGREQFKSMPRYHGGWGETATSFTRLLYRIYEVSGEQNYLLEAIRTLREMLNSDLRTADEHQKALLKYQLASAIRERWKVQKDSINEVDVSEPMNLLFDAAESNGPDHLLRVESTLDLCDTCFLQHKKMDWKRLSRATETAIHLLPRITSRSLHLTDQKGMLRRISRIASLASAVAFASGMGLENQLSKAVELLEHGRGVISNFVLEKKADTSSLRTEDSVLAQELETKMDELKHASRESELTDDIMSKFDLVKKHQLNEELDAILEKIRLKDGFESFFLPQKTTELQSLCDGTIVVINVSFRCDAIIVREGRLEHFQLRDLKEDDIEPFCVSMSFVRSHRGSEAAGMVLSGILRFLWEKIVGPILTFIGCTQTPGENDVWPRVWWIPTGSLCQLPIHAAGMHEPGQNNSAIDRVISSYSASIKALKFTQENRKKTPRSCTGDVILAYMSTTPGSMDPLGCAESEATQISKVLSPLIRPIVIKQPHKRDIIERLQSCDIFHFAGHGTSDMRDPYMSCIHLEDWQHDPFNVQTLVDLGLYRSPPWLAYLSACSTGENRDKNLHDEAIHLVSGCQLAGFQHVIGSFWEVSDCYSDEISKDFYEMIKYDIGKKDIVALGLHHATRRLRGINQSTNQTGLSPEDVEGYGKFGRNFSDSERREVEEFRDSIGRFENTECVNYFDFRDPGEAIRVGHNKVGSQSESPFIWAAYFHVGL